MINIEKYREVLDSGLLLDHYFVLCTIKSGGVLDSNKRIQGFLNLLAKKGFIQDDNLTDKALDLISDCDIIFDEESKNKVDFSQFVEELHKKLQDKLVELTGKRQVTAKVKGTGRGYPFLPNVTDLGKTLVKTLSAYKIHDYEKVERTLLKYVDACAEGNEWFPILRYYIMKDGNSQMVTDLDNEEEVSNTTTSIQKFV